MWSLPCVFDHSNCRALPRVFSRLKISSSPCPLRRDDIVAAARSRVPSDTRPGDARKDELGGREFAHQLWRHCRRREQRGSISSVCVARLALFRLVIIRAYVLSRGGIFRLCAAARKRKLNESRAEPIRNCDFHVQAPFEAFMASLMPSFPVWAQIGLSGTVWATSCRHRHGHPRLPKKALSLRPAFFAGLPLRLPVATTTLPLRGRVLSTSHHKRLNAGPAIIHKRCKLRHK